MTAIFHFLVAILAGCTMAAQPYKSLKEVEQILKNLAAKTGPKNRGINFHYPPRYSHLEVKQRSQDGEENNGNYDSAQSTEFYHQPNNVIIQKQLEDDLQQALMSESNRICKAIGRCGCSAGRCGREYKAVDRTVTEMDQLLRVLNKDINKQRNRNFKTDEDRRQKYDNRREKYSVEQHQYRNKRYENRQEDDRRQRQDDRRPRQDDRRQRQDDKRQENEDRRQNQDDSRQDYDDRMQRQENDNSRQEYDRRQKQHDSRQRQHNRRPKYPFKKLTSSDKRYRQDERRQDNDDGRQKKEYYVGRQEYDDRRQRQDDRIQELEDRRQEYRAQLLEYYQDYDNDNADDNDIDKNLEIATKNYRNAGFDVVIIDVPESNEFQKRAKDIRIVDIRESGIKDLLQQRQISYDKKEQKDFRVANLNLEDFVAYYKKIKEELTNGLLKYVKGLGDGSYLVPLSPYQKKEIENLKNLQVKKPLPNYDLKAKIVQLLFGSLSNIKILPHSKDSHTIYIPQQILNAIPSLNRQNALRSRLFPLTFYQKQRQRNRAPRNFILNHSWRRNNEQPPNYGVPFNLQVQGLGQVN